MRVNTLALTLAGFAATSLSCDVCEHPEHDVVLTRNVPRMQPDAQKASSQPRGPLEWGQVNFLHTTDTHGWLEGHLKEQNYGADWGDFSSFVRGMRSKAQEYDVDLLLIDTGDLHDGAGLSDATSPNGALSNPVFEQIDYDLLTIGNHELYISEIAYETFNQFSKYYGDKYLTSNVQIKNPTTGQFEYIGKTHRYFTTPKGLRIMSFGLLFNFAGNSNVSQVIPAAQVVNQTWFQDAINTKDPIDLFLLIGHNPVRGSGSTFNTLFQAIRKAHPNTPIQLFGGHTHIRDFAVYDDKSTALESGRYCETLGWLSMSGFGKDTGYRGPKNPTGVPNPTMKAVKPSSSTSSTQSTGSSSTSPNQSTSSSPTSAARKLKRTTTSPAQKSSSSMSSTSRKSSSSLSSTSSKSSSSLSSTSQKTSPSLSSTSSKSSSSPTSSPSSTMVYARRYLDWNRLTFEYHARDTQRYTTFDTPKGEAITKNITDIRHELNLTSLYGCAPQTWCLSCAPFGSQGSIYTILSTALSTVVVNKTRATKPRLIILNTGSVRFDLPEGPFTLDDSYIVNPFTDAFQFIPDVPYSAASTVLATLNAGAFEKRSPQLSSRDFGFYNPSLPDTDSCIDPPTFHTGTQKRSLGRIIRHQNTNKPTPGYTTTDDFGKDGDDTVHAPIPYYRTPNNFQANASFPTDGSNPQTVDLVFLDFIQSNVLNALAKAGQNYTAADVSYYLPKEFTTNSYLPAYAKVAPDWQKNVPNCPVGLGVGYNDTPTA